MLYYNKIPFRDLLSYEFILSQGKLYGLNLQKPIYFFGKEKGDVGAIDSIIYEHAGVYNNLTSILSKGNDAQQMAFDMNPEKIKDPKHFEKEPFVSSATQNA
jgi:hypothetical protein